MTLCNIFICQLSMLVLLLNYGLPVKVVGEGEGEQGALCLDSVFAVRGA